MIGFYDYTVIATYLATVLGVGGIFLAADGLHLPAVFCLLLAGLLDTFDGRIARTKKDRSEQQKHFGIQIDSLNDLICFGVLPAMICRGAYAASPAYLSLGGPVGRILPPVWFDAALCFFVLAGLIRLGYFNVTEEERQEGTSAARKYYLETAHHVEHADDPAGIPAVGAAARRFDRDSDARGARDRASVHRANPCEKARPARALRTGAHRRSRARRADYAGALKLHNNNRGRVNTRPLFIVSQSSRRCKPPHVKKAEGLFHMRACRPVGELLEDRQHARGSRPSGCTPRARAPPDTRAG